MANKRVHISHLLDEYITGDDLKHNWDSYEKALRLSFELIQLSEKFKQELLMVKSAPSGEHFDKMIQVMQRYINFGESHNLK